MGCTKTSKRSLSLKFLWTIWIFFVAMLRPGLTQRRPSYLDEILASKAHNISKYMNTYVDPCYDFYEFACGNFPRRYPVDLNHQVQTSALKVVEANLEGFIADALSENYDRRTTHMRPKNFYNSCVNLPNLHLLYKAQLKAIIAEFGQMPAISYTWSDAEFDWLKIVAEISYKYDIQIMLGRYVRNLDEKGNTLLLDLPSFGLGNVELYLDPANSIYLNEYTSSVEQHLTHYLDLHESYAKEIAQEIVAFDVTLGLGAASSTRNRCWTSVSRLQQKYSNKLNLLRYLEIALGFRPGQEFVEECSEYHEYLIYVIGITPNRVIANYIFYSLIRPFMLSPIPDSGETLQSSCVTLTRSYFGDLVDRILYANLSNKKEGLSAVRNVVYDLKTIVEFSLRSGDYFWIMGDKRKHVKKTLKEMGITFKAYYLNNFYEKYGELPTDAYDFIENLKAIFSQNAQRTRALKPSFEKPSLSFLPQYNRWRNTLEIPIGFIQSFLLWSDFYPVSIKLSQFGYFIAHEIIHAIDLISGSDRECSKKVAHVGGLRLTHKLFQTWLEYITYCDVSKDWETLPNLHFPDEQMFFIGFAQLWCNDVNPIYSYLHSPDHPSGRFKLMEALTNLPAFSEAFQCPHIHVKEILDCRNY